VGSNPTLSAYFSKFRQVASSPTQSPLPFRSTSRFQSKFHSQKQVELRACLTSSDLSARRRVSKHPFETSTRGRNRKVMAMSGAKEMLAAGATCSPGADAAVSPREIAAPCPNHHENPCGITRPEICSTVQRTSAAAQNPSRRLSFPDRRWGEAQKSPRPFPSAHRCPSAYFLQPRFKPIELGRKSMKSSRAWNV
jgi:hypothetical protein